jgi:hypothetical protein
MEKITSASGVQNNLELNHQNQNNPTPPSSGASSASPPLPPSSQSSIAQHAPSVNISGPELWGSPPGAPPSFEDVKSAAAELNKSEESGRLLLSALDSAPSDREFLLSLEKQFVDLIVTSKPSANMLKENAPILRQFLKGREDLAKIKLEGSAEEYKNAMDKHARLIKEHQESYGKNLRWLVLNQKPTHQDMVILPPLNAFFRKLAHLLADRFMLARIVIQPSKPQPHYQQQSPSLLQVRLLLFLNFEVNIKSTNTNTFTPSLTLSHSLSYSFHPYRL